MSLFLLIYMGDYVAYEALRYLGVSYRYGGLDTTGLDCSGLVNIVFNKFGVSLPRRSRDIASAGVEVPLDSLMPGDILAFSREPGGSVSHVGIYVGNGRFVHASSSRGVVVDSLNRYYLNRLRTIRRFRLSKDAYLTHIISSIRKDAIRTLFGIDSSKN